MGPNLQVSSQALDELISALNGFSGRLAHACRDIAVADNRVNGSDPLAGQVHEFAASWQYGIGQLRQHSSGCVEELHKVGRAFARLDAHLAAELQKGMGKK